MANQINPINIISLLQQNYNDDCIVSPTTFEEICLAKHISSIIFTAIKNQIILNWSSMMNWSLMIARIHMNMMMQIMTMRLMLTIHQMVVMKVRQNRHKKVINFLNYFPISLQVHRIHHMCQVRKNLGNFIFAKKKQNWNFITLTAMYGQ